MSPDSNILSETRLLSTSFKFFSVKSFIEIYEWASNTLLVNELCHVSNSRVGDSNDFCSTVEMTTLADTLLIFLPR